MSITLCKNIGSSEEGVIPWCHYMKISRGVYETDLDVPMNDPRIKWYKDKDFLTFEVEHASNHYFDDVGYLRCQKCGWTP